MKHLLSTTGLLEIGRYARAGTLLGLDFDGTLAPIVHDRDAARPDSATLELLAEVGRHYPTVVITGRARADAGRLLDFMGGVEVVGSHGAEDQESADPAAEVLVGKWRAELSGCLPPDAGIEIEDKRYSLSVHYRAHRDPVAARDAILHAGAKLEGARVFGGNAVVNIVPAGAPDKGAALLKACARHGCPRAIYVGDDVTDEDVFSLDCADKILTVRVHRDEASRAAYFLRERSEVDELLKILLRYAALR